jgi:hypothetical protein
MPLQAGGLPRFGFPTVLPLRDAEEMVAHAAGDLRPRGFPQGIDEGITAGTEENVTAFSLDPLNLVHREDPLVQENLRKGRHGFPFSPAGPLLFQDLPNLIGQGELPLDAQTTEDLIPAQPRDAGSIRQAGGHRPELLPRQPPLFLEPYPEPKGEGGIRHAGKTRVQPILGEESQLHRHPAEKEIVFTWRLGP